MKYKEDVLASLISNTISLSGKDYQFFVGLELYRSKNHFITSGQADLFDRLLIKYQKQWKKANIDAHELIQLPWETNIRMTSVGFITAKVSLQKDMIIVVAPFNQKFVELIDRNHYFSWVKYRSRYEGRFTTSNLKLITELLPQHFNHIEYCAQTQAILQKVEKLNAKYWNPTLVKSNGKFYIAAINHILAKYVEDIELSDDPDTVKRLRSMGITIPEVYIDINQIDEQKSQDNSKRRSKL